MRIGAWSSDPFQLYFPEEWDPGLPEKVAAAIRAQSLRDKIPVGTIIASVLPPGHFFSQSHPQYQEKEWALADGALLPPGSAYGRLTGANTTPDLRYLDQGHVLMDTKIATLKHGQNVLELSQNSTAPAAAAWTWMSSGRDKQGLAYNNAWEQDVDHFQHYIDESGVAVSQGRTYNRKHRKWGAWKAGEATVLGIASKQVGLFHYIKIN